MQLAIGLHHEVETGDAATYTGTVYMRQSAEVEDDAAASARQQFLHERLKLRSFRPEHEAAAQGDHRSAVFLFLMSYL